jgi:nickel/cobalt transporter (NicO) family protein
MRRLVLLLALIGALCAPGIANAHPLGNFTTNRYSEIDVSGNRLYVLYVLDLAEIPTFQEKPKVRALGEDGYARALARQLRGGLSLTAGGSPRVLKELRRALAFPQGVGGLHTTRLEIVYDAGPAFGGRVTYADGNFADRIGWKEVVVRAGDGASIISSTAPRASVSNRLLAYPKDLLRSPLDVTTAQARFSPGVGPGTPPPVLQGRDLRAPVRVASRSDRGFVGLVARDDLSTGIVLVSILVALFWGAAHALTPGHGKAIVAAFLVGSRGTPRHAVLLGAVVTATHTAGVFALGLVTLALSEFIVPEKLYPWLNLVSALLVVGVGLSVLRLRLRDRRKHHHEHHYDHGERSLRDLLAIGVSGGLLPCPTALVVLLAAISLHRVGYGLLLIVAFSLGLAGAMTAVGLLAVSAKRVFSRMSFEGRLIRLLPAVSALAILGFGLAMTVRSIPGVI